MLRNVLAAIGVLAVIAVCVLIYIDHANDDNNTPECAISAGQDDQEATEANPERKEPGQNADLPTPPAAPADGGPRVRENTQRAPRRLVVVETTPEPPLMGTAEPAVARPAMDSDEQLDRSVETAKQEYKSAMDAALTRLGRSRQ